MRYKTWFKGTYCGNLAKYVRGSFASLSCHKLINNKISYERLPKKQNSSLVAQIGSLLLRCAAGRLSNNNTEKSKDLN